MFAALLVATSGVAFGQSKASATTTRDQVGIVYFIGSVQSVARGAAVVDLGDVHTLRERDTLAVFRTRDGYLTPLGTLEVQETFGPYSGTEKAHGFEAEPGDVVIFVRELSQMRSFVNHMDHVLGNRLTRSRKQNFVSVPGRPEAVEGLLNYREDQPQWVRNLGEDEDTIYVVGELYGASFADGAPDRLSRLTDQIDLLRDLHLAGNSSVAAASEGWATVMPVLYGQTVTTDVRSRDAVASEDAVAGENRAANDGRHSVSERDFSRRVRRVGEARLFDRPAEQRNSLSALLVARLKNPGGSDDLWFKARLPRTQFPKLADDDQFLEDIRTILRQLRG